MRGEGGEGRGKRFTSATVLINVKRIFYIDYL